MTGISRTYMIKHMNQRLTNMFFLSILIFISTNSWVAADPSDASSEKEILIYSKPFAGVYIKDGQETNRIVFRHGPKIAPRLSTKGTKLLINSDRGGKWGIWIGNRSGKQMQRICDGDQAEWSPQADKIVFRRNGLIIERNLSTGKERILSPPSWTDCQFPTYRSGKSIIFVKGSDLMSKIIQLDLQDNGIPRVVLQAQIESAPRCSPDGRVLAYQDGAHIHLLNFENGNTAQLTTAGGIQGWPMWSLDGKSLTYCQTSDPLGPWEVHHVQVAHPTSVRIIQREVDPAHYWQGIAAKSGLSASLKGSNLSVWESSSNSVDLDQIQWPIAPEEGWEPLPLVHDRLSMRRPILIENDWYCVLIAPKKGVISLLSKIEVNNKNSAAIALTAEGASDTDGIAYSYTVVINDRKEFLCEISLSTETGRAIKANFRISRESPLIQLTPLADLSEFAIVMNQKFVLIPDIFSNDLLIEATTSITPEITLPACPLVLAPAASGRSLLMVATSSPQQKIMLQREDEIFSHIRSFPVGESVFVSLLPTESFFYDLTPQIKSNIKSETLQWASPVSGRWRSSLFGARNYSAMLHESKESKNDIEIHIGDDTNLMRFALIYLSGRTSKTPLNILTLKDIFYDTIHSAAWSYHHQDMKFIRHHSPKNYWHNQLLTHSDLSLILDLFGSFPKDSGLYMADSRGLNSYVSHLCHDITNLLQHLDERISEYQESLSQIQHICESEKGVSPATDRFLSTIMHRIKSQRTLISKLPPRTLTDVEQSSNKILDLLGSDAWLAKTKEYEKFCNITSAALSIRQNTLTKSREFLMRLRETSGYAVIQNPQLKRIADKLRWTTRDILRNRYAIEGD